MAVFQPFQGFRPRADKAEAIASKPYDVLNTAEARVEAAGNPLSFLHVVKSEIDLPEGTHAYDLQVYAKARENLDELIRLGHLVQDDQDCFYIYQQEMNGRTQTGLVGCCSVEDYRKDVIRKHEHTRQEKEADRIRHVETTDANTGPVFLTYPTVLKIDELVEDWKQEHQAVVDFVADNVRHVLWILDDSAKAKDLVSSFSKVKNLYVADGHHRSASAAIVGQKRSEANPKHNGSEEYNRFLAVCFPSEQLHIMDYNRVVKDFGERDCIGFLRALEEAFEIEEVGHKGEVYTPQQRGEFGLYAKQTWYRLRAKQDFVPNHPVMGLDVAVLQNEVLTKLLSIEDPRTDTRIDFVGGIRGLFELEKRVDEDGWAFAVSMFPTSIDDLMAVADAGEVMPPKSTWFEPKLRSGLIVHKLS
jgi:uncharacterized protein (DUF1015 family)